MRFLSASETTKANDVPSTMYSTENTSSLRESLETTARVLVEEFSFINYNYKLFVHYCHI